MRPYAPEPRSEPAVPAVRTKPVAILIGLGFLATAGAQFSLMVLERDHTLKQGERLANARNEHIDLARRGSVYGRDGKPFALDDPSMELQVDFDRVPQNDAFFVDLSQAAGIPASEFSGFSHRGVSSRRWKTTLGPTRAREVLRVKSAWRADGIGLDGAGRRSYPLGEEAASIIGTVADGRPLLGLELSQDGALRGENGRISGSLDRHGRFLPTRIDEGSVDRQDGQNVVLTLDSSLQSAAFRAVRRAVRENKAKDGVAIVMMPGTGEILAMASYPSFAPVRPDGGPADLSGDRGFNPATQGVLEPGSTFKILSLAFALNEGKFGPKEHLYCPGILKVPGGKVHCDNHHGTRAHGDVEMVSAIARSCNVAAATWALRIGRERFFRYLDSVHLFDRPGLGLPKETRGLVNRDDYARQLQLATLGFGQSMSTAPISLAAAFAMLANDGKYVQPKLIQSVGGQPYRPEPDRRFADAQILRPEVTQEVLSAMEATIQSDFGTGSKLRIPGYRLGGKTGTAQKLGKNVSGYVANFVGFVPANRPQAVVLVMVNDPRGGKFYGGEVAGPVFVEIARSVVRRLGIAPTEPITLPKRTLTGRGAVAAR